MRKTFQSIPVVFAIASLLGGIQSSAQDPSHESFAATVDYDVKPRPRGSAGNRHATWQAFNLAQGLRSQFDETGVRIHALSESSGSLKLSFVGYGRGADVRVFDAAVLEADGRRMRYRRDGVDEWYVNDVDGVEQGFVLSTPPEQLPLTPVARRAHGGRSAVNGGDSPAFVVLLVNGDLIPRISADGQAIDFAPRAGGLSALRYSKLEVTDAVDRELDSWMELFDDGSVQGIRLLFDDSGADYPITIDPLVTSASWSVEGDLTGARLGWSVAGAGDVNDDGFDDVIVGAPDAPVDLNTDGTVDCGPGTGNSECAVGVVSVYHGSLSGLSTTLNWTVEGDQAGARFGHALSGAGDVNGDGFADVVIGQPDYDGVAGADAGRAYLFTGSSSGLAATPAWTAEGEQLDAHFGWSLSGAGDVDGDELSDWIVGAPDHDGPAGVDEGRAYVYHGSTSNFDPLPAWTADGDQAGARFGYAVAGAGDVNGAEFDDVIVGSPFYDDPAQFFDQGRARIYLGTQAFSGLAPLPVWSAVGETAEAHLGWSVASAGDSNDDGKDDWIVGAPDDGTNGNGRAYVYFGSNPVVMTSQPAAEWIGEVSRARFGVSVSGAGDIDGDGTHDALIGATGWGERGDPNFRQQGRARLFYGPAEPQRNWGWDARGVQLFERLGYALSSAGDVNRDGIPDVIVGSPFFHRGQFEEGRAQVFHGARGINAATLAGRLGIPIVNGTPRIRVESPRGLTLDPQDSADAVWFGPTPGSVLLSTGRAVDGGLGDTDWGLTAGAGSPPDGLPDAVSLEFSALVPSGKQTFCFATQFITSEVPQDTDLARLCVNRDGGTCTLDQNLTGLAFQQKNPAMRHCVDVSGRTTVFLRFEVADGEGNGRQDSALLLSNFYFSDLAMPEDVRPDTVNGYFNNPTPADVSRQAGTFSANQDLFAVPGMSMPFYLKISYDSASIHRGSLGQKWMHSYESLARGFADGTDPGTSPDDILVRVGEVTTYFEETDSCGISNTPCKQDSECPPGESCVATPGVYRSKFGGDFGAIDISADPDTTRPIVTYASKDGVTYEFADNIGTCYFGAAEGSSCDVDANCPGGICNFDGIRLTTMTDVNGHEIAFSYDSQDRLTQVTDTRGECFSLAYDLSDRLRSVAPGCPPAPNEADVRLSYDAAGFLREVIDLAGRSTRYTYFDDGTLATSTDGDGVLVMSNSYESFVGLGLDQGGERLVRQRDARNDDPGRSLFYEAESVTDTDRLGRSSRSSFDVKGRLAITTDRTGIRQEFTYDRNNRQIESRRRLPSEPVARLAQSNIYDSRGNPVAQAAFPDTCVGGPDRGSACGEDDDCRNSTCGVGVQSSYDLRDNLQSTTDPAGNTWTFEFDAQDNLTRETDPLGNEVTHSYGFDVTGQKVIPRPLETTEPRGYTSTCDYDTTTGYLTAATGPLGGTVRHTYDGLGRRTSTTDPIGVANPGSDHTTCIGYDAVGLIQAKSALCTEDCQTCQLRTEFTYDERGRLLTTTGADGALFRTTYTPTGLVQARIDPLGSSARFEYDVADRLISRTAPNPAEHPGGPAPVPPQSTEFAYDMGDRLSSVRAYESQDGDLLAEVQTTYDEVGDATCVVDPSGNTFRMEYDLLGRITRLGPAASCQAAITSPVSLEYNALGVLDSLTNARGDTISYAYDSAGRLTGTSSGDTSITHILDGHGNRTWSDRDGATITRTFDPLDRITSRTDDFGNTVGYVYDAAGNIARLDYPSGVSVTYEYDGKRRMTRVTDWNGKSTRYTYNAGGNIDTITLPDGSTVTFSYDPARRLIGISDPGIGFDASYTLNRAGVSVAAAFALPLDPEPSIQYPQADESFTHGSVNQLISRGSFDADGNMTSANIDGIATTLTYDPLYQVTSIEREGQGSRLFRYDADGMRVVVDDNGVRRRYVHDITAPVQRILEERDEANNVVARYVHGLGLVSREGPDGLTSYRVYHYDKRGSTLALTDQTGAITDRYAYDPFGKLVNSVGTSENPFRYGGRDGVVDDDNGLYYMRSRYYAPELMRFVQQDQVFKGAPTDTQSLNRYAFVQNNPIDLTDPNGDLIFTTIGVAVTCLPGSDLSNIVNVIDQQSRRAQGVATGSKTETVQLGCTFPEFAGAVVQGAILDGSLLIGAAVSISGFGLPVAIVFGASTGAAAGFYGALTEEILEKQGIEKNFGPIEFAKIEPGEEGFSVREVVVRTTVGAATGAIGGATGSVTYGATGISSAPKALFTTKGFVIRALGTTNSISANVAINAGFNEIWEDPDAGPVSVDPTTASPTRLRPAAPAGPVVPSGTVADRLSPLLFPVPGRQRTTTCGCACEVWK